MFLCGCFFRLLLDVSRLVNEFDFNSLLVGVKFENYLFILRSNLVLVLVGAEL